MKTAEEWCEEMFSRNNWVVADTITVKAIQLDALKFAREFYKNLQFGQADDAILSRILELESSPEKEGG